MGLTRNPDRGRLTGVVQLGKVDRIPPVGIDPLAWLSRDQRWGDHFAFVSRSGELPLDAITAWSGCITKPQISSRRSPVHAQRLQGSWRVGDLPMLAHFSPQARFGQRDRDRILVHVKAKICDRLRHDPSPMHEARYRTIRHNPRSLHTVRRAASIRRTSGLAERRRLHFSALGREEANALSTCEIACERMTPP